MQKLLDDKYTINVVKEILLLQLVVVVYVDTATATTITCGFFGCRKHVVIIQDPLVQDGMFSDLLHLVEQCQTAKYFLFQGKFHEHTSGTLTDSANKCRYLYGSLGNASIGVFL